MSSEDFISTISCADFINSMNEHYDKNGNFNIINQLTINDITDIIETLINSENLKAIKKFLINIPIINITTIILKYIIKHKIKFNNLDCIICSSKSITDDKLMKFPDTITKLDVFGCTYITDMSIKYFKHLTHLNISSTNITDDALKDINLKYFSCSNTFITGNGYSHMTNLVFIDINYNKMDIIMCNMKNMKKLKYIGCMFCDNYKSLSLPNNVEIVDIILDDVQIFEYMRHIKKYIKINI
jgi:hypothetical protein